MIARWHEWRLHWASRPALALLLRSGRLTGPVRRLPGLGWVIADPVLARRLLNDHSRTSVLGEGGVGHLWEQVLGDWVTELFDGPGHAALRARSRDLFTERTGRELTARAIGVRCAEAAATLRHGGTVDVAALAKVLVGRVVTDLLGLDTPDDDRAYAAVFARGERLAALALGTAASTRLDPATVTAARALVEGLTVNVESSWRTAGTDTLLGRCRELGIGLRETKGLASLLMVAGTETAATAMARTVALLADTGQVPLLLAEPARVPDAVREGLRVTTPAPVIGRHVTADLTLAGHRIRAGERVLVLAWGANNAPGGFDLRRAYVPETRQLWFGAGRHLCLGAPLARAEVGELLDALLTVGRPWRVVRRRYARKQLIPGYAALEVAC